MNAWGGPSSRDSGSTGTRAARVPTGLLLLHLTSLAEVLGRTVCVVATLAWMQPVAPGEVNRAAVCPCPSLDPRPPQPSRTLRLRTTARLESPCCGVRRVRKLTGLPLPRSFDLDAFRSGSRAAKLTPNQRARDLLLGVGGWEEEEEEVGRHRLLCFSSSLPPQVLDPCLRLHHVPREEASGVESRGAARSATLRDRLHLILDPSRLRPGTSTGAELGSRRRPWPELASSKLRVEVPSTNGASESRAHPPSVSRHAALVTAHLEPALKEWCVTMSWRPSNCPRRLDLGSALVGLT